MAIDLRKSRFATEIIGVDNRPEHTSEALQLGLVDRIADFETGVKEADLVLLALPVDQIILLLPRVLDLISPSSTVVDVGSTKRQIVASVADHPLRGNFVPTHPMAGTENSGPSAAIAKLFAGKLTIVCDHAQCRPQHLATPFPLRSVYLDHAVTREPFRRDTTFQISFATNPIDAIGARMAHSSHPNGVMRSKLLRPGR